MCSWGGLDYAVNVNHRFAIAPAVLLAGCTALAGLDALRFDGGAGGEGGQGMGGTAGGSTGGGGGAAGAGASGGAAGHAGLAGGGGAAGGGGQPPTGYAAAVLGDNPVAYWRLGDAAGSSQVKNDVAGGPAGIIAGAVTLGLAGALPGDADTAASFDGTTGQIHIGDFFDFVGSAPFSLEAWVYPVTVDGMNRRVLNKEPAGGGDGWDLAIASDVGLRFERYGGALEDTVNRTAVPTDDWTHVAGTYDGSSICVYLNGIGTCAAATIQIPDSLANLTIGNRDGDDRHFDGRLDEVAIYDHALSANQVLAHFQAAGR